MSSEMRAITVWPNEAPNATALTDAGGIGPAGAASDIEEIVSTGRILAYRVRSESQFYPAPGVWARVTELK